MTLSGSDSSFDSTAHIDEVLAAYEKSKAPYTALLMQPYKSQMSKSLLAGFFDENSDYRI